MTNIISSTILKSKVCIYRELLPKQRYIKSERISRSFTEAEDNLISLGLEMFNESCGNVFRTYEHVRKYFFTSKTAGEIYTRAKKLKSTKAKANPVKYFYAYKEAPPMPRSVQYFDPSEVRAPKDYSDEYLPDWLVTGKKRELIKMAKAAEKEKQSIEKAEIAAQKKESKIKAQLAAKEKVSKEKAQLSAKKRQSKIKASLKSN